MYSGVFKLFFFFFHAKSGTKNDHRNKKRDISYLSHFSCDLNELQNFRKHFLSVEKNRFDFLDFLV